MVEVAKAAPRPRLYIIGDSHQPFKSMADGKMYDSKSAYRAELKARGFEEVACSTESRIMAEVEYAKPQMPELTTAEVNHCAESIGYRWND